MKSIPKVTDILNQAGDVDQRMQRCKLILYKNGLFIKLGIYFEYGLVFGFETLKSITQKRIPRCTIILTPN